VSDWHDWHAAYDDAESWQARRLVTVRQRIGMVLDEAGPGPLNVLAMVAGQGRDLLPVLADHPRRDEVTARLVELDARNADAARATARAAGLTTVEVITGDAARTDHYLGAAPADLVLICGLFPHIAAEDVDRVVRHSTALTKPGGSLIWTMHRRPPDMVPDIAGWFEREGFEPVWVTDPAVEHAVAVHRFRGQPQPLAADLSLFTFVGIRALRPWDYTN
jgi:SAM-dependent methyltransferase